MQIDNNAEGVMDRKFCPEIQFATGNEVITWNATVVGGIAHSTRFDPIAMGNIVV